MKKILISIRPQWVEKILNGKKTLEIRKTAPKCDLPCEVYIYCTKLVPYGRGCMYDEVAKRYMTTFCNDGKELPNLTGRVVAKFTLNKVEGIERNQFSIHWTKTLKGTDLCEMSCLTPTQLSDYLRSKKGYAWHIDNLVPFDRPKELKDFGVKRSPQSWQFIEVEE